MPVLSLPGVELAYFQEGSRLDIVWIPGGDNVGRDWGDQIAAFRADHRNTAYDPRGAGIRAPRRRCLGPSPTSRPIARA